MQSVCRACRSLATTRYPCKVCNSESSMSHTHCDEEFHYSLPYGGERVPGRHYWVDCDQRHTHPHVGNHEHAEDGSVINDEPPQRRPFGMREAYLLSAPWITKTRGKVQCAGATRKGRCKKRGKYKYRTLKRSWSKTGNYCWDHLPLANDLEEMNRWDRFIAKRPPEWKEQSNDAPEAPAAP